MHCCVAVGQQRAEENNIYILYVLYEVSLNKNQGVVIDATFSQTHHIEIICKKIQHLLYLLAAVRPGTLTYK